MGGGGGMRSAGGSYSNDQYNAQIAANKAQYDAQLADRQKEWDQRFKKMTTTAGYIDAPQSAQERQAGVTPPGFQGIVDPSTGQLLDQYKVDPFSGKASSQLRDEAFSNEPSKWAKSALGQQGFEESQARGAAGLQQQQAQNQAQSQLMRLGGLSGGARTSLARSGARDALMAGQNVGSQGIVSRYGINQQDLQRKQTLLGQNADLERQAQLTNIGSTKENLAARQAFDQNRYNQLMQAWAAKSSAAAMG